MSPDPGRAPPSQLVVNWRPGLAACGLNVTGYFVDVQTSSPLLNRFVGLFGVFPQDVCAAGSKARQSLSVNGQTEIPSACSPYPEACGRLPLRLSAVPIPLPLRALAGVDVEVWIRAYGTLAPVGQPGRSQAITFWCHKYRRPRPDAIEIAPRSERAVPRWQRWLRQRVQWRRRGGSHAESGPPLARAAEGWGVSLDQEMGAWHLATGVGALTAAMMVWRRAKLAPR